MPYTKDGHGYHNTDTSYDAALSISPSAASYEAKCLEAMKAHGDLTPDEAAVILGVSVLTVRPRFTALRQAGRIADSGQRRPNANNRKTIVWRLK
jgi:predicted ArsR family transcriptional regulator